MMNILSYSVTAFPEHSFWGGSVNHVLLAFLLLAIISALRMRGRISFLEQEKDLLLSAIHQTIHSLRISKSMQEELDAGNLPPLASTEIRRLETQIVEMLNINKSALAVSQGKAEDDSPTDEYELYTYITSLVNRFRDYAENCRVKLNVCTDAGYRICNIHEMAFTAALQGLLKRIIGSTRPNGRVNIIVSCRDDQWSLEISNYPPERDYRKYFGLFLTFMKICFGGNLRFIWQVVKSHGGKISGYECGNWVHYEITAPLSSDNFPVSAVEHLMHTDGQPHIVLIMEDRQLSGYLEAALSDIYSVSVYEHYEQINISLSRENTDIIIIDAKSANSEVCSLIKNNKQTSDVPILLLTPSNDVEDLKEFETWRADRFLPRIVPIERLKAELFSIREESRQQLERVIRLVNTDFAAGFPEDLMLSKEDAEIMKKINGFVKEHLGGKIKTGMLAQELGVSPTGFYMLVKRITHVSPTWYILCYRMERAQNLLLAQPSSIGDVATAVGYDSNKYFGIVFKRFFGCAPREYREKYGR